MGLRGSTRRVALTAMAIAVVVGVALLAGCGGGPGGGGGQAASAGQPQDAVDKLIAARRARPAAVEPVVGVPEATAAIPTDVPPPARGRGVRISPGAPSDAQVRSQLEALQREQAKVERAILASGAPLQGGTGRFVWPVVGPITSPFCERRAWEACHPGIDIGVGTGTPIRAADSGQVVLAGPQGGYGNFTCVRHTQALTTCYAHQSQILVQIGQPVRQGQVIGLVGCTGLCFGAHLHFEVRVNGQVVNPLGYL